MELLKELSDARLETVAKTHARGIFNMGLWMMHDAAAAEALLQEVFSQALSEITCCAEDGELGKHLWKTAVGAIDGKLKKADGAVAENIDAFLPIFDSRGRMRGMATPLPKDWEGEAQARIARELERGIVQLPYPYRLVVAACDVGGLSAEETAEALGLEVRTVKTRLHHARLFLTGRLALVAS